MSTLSPQSNSYAAHGECPIVIDRVFKCLECQQYVVFPSVPPKAPAGSGSMPTDLPVPAFEAIDQSDCSQDPFSYDFYSLQLPAPDPSDLGQLAISPSTFPVSFVSQDIPQFPLLQSIDVPTADPYYNTCDLSTVALLRLEIDQLKNTVHTLQESYVNPTNHAGHFHEEVPDIPAELQKFKCKDDDLETRLREVEDYLPSLRSWAVGATESLNWLQECQEIESGRKKQQIL
ncbi:hypothetical protein F5884DRAFT_863666 [Xylogone sp. PMI_703]|nr:hypothetical protein F5884DRAFT_863666 [Xylogone sp. PMI_703]